MKYTIKHACGHESEKQLYGKGELRKKAIARLEKTDCVNCRAKQALSYYNLSGSNAQIAWAGDLIDKALYGISRFKREYDLYSLELVAKWYLSHDKASWYIDNQLIDGVYSALDAMSREEIEAIGREVKKSYKDTENLSPTYKYKGVDLTDEEERKIRNKIANLTSKDIKNEQ